MVSPYYTDNVNINLKNTHNKKNNFINNNYKNIVEFGQCSHVRSRNKSMVSRMLGIIIHYYTSCLSGRLIE